MFDLGPTVPGLIAEALSTTASVSTNYPFPVADHTSVQPLIINGCRSTRTLTSFSHFMRTIASVVPASWGTSFQPSSDSENLVRTLFPHFSINDDYLPGYSFTRPLAGRDPTGFWRQEFIVDEAILRFSAPVEGAVEGSKVVCDRVMAVECTTKGQASLELLSGWVDL